MTKNSQSPTGLVLQFPYAGRPFVGEALIEESYIVLSLQERQLYHELLRVAQRLDRHGVPGVYSEVASVAGTVTRLKREGRSAIAALAQGLDALKRYETAYRQGAGATCKLVLGIALVLLSVWWALSNGLLTSSF